MDFKNKSNEELMKLLKEMEVTHSNIRARMINDFDNMERVEKDYEKVQEILKHRIK